VEVAEAPKGPVADEALKVFAQDSTHLYVFKRQEKGSSVSASAVGFIVGAIRVITINDTYDLELEVCPRFAPRQRLAQEPKKLAKAVPLGTRIENQDFSGDIHFRDPADEPFFR